MDLTPTSSTGTLDTDTQTPPPPPPPPAPNQIPPFTNRSLRRHSAASSPPPSTVSCFRECLRNHAASLGGHALDGCGEFMPSAEPRSLTCAACGCHRNFHRRHNTTTQDQIFPNSPTFISFYPSLPPPPSRRGISPSPSQSPSPSPSPPPPHHHRHNNNSATAATSHVLLALGEERHVREKKRHRTKFSAEQKEKMHEFCEKLGWRMPNSDNEGMVQEFCNSIGVSRGVFKVWMHNHKNNNTMQWKRSLQLGNNGHHIED